MLDTYIRPLINKPLNYLGEHLASMSIHANVITLTGFIIGLLAMSCIALSHYSYGAVFLLINRLFDGLDGAVARATKLTIFGGFLDIVCDFIIYSGIVFSFALSRVDMSIYATFLIFSFIGPMSSFLAYAILASKRNITSSLHGRKSFYYSDGICEGSETILALVLICMIPDYFHWIAVIYGTLCWITTIGRTLRARDEFNHCEEH